MAFAEKAKLKLFEAYFAFGSRSGSRFCFTGIDLKQRADDGIVLSQSAYIRKFSAVKIDPVLKSQLAAAVTEAETRQRRAIIGTLQYASVHTRPDLAGGLSMLQCSIPKATVATLLQANRLPREAKRFHETSIVIQPIPVKGVRFLAFCDASVASATNLLGASYLPRMQSLGRLCPAVLADLVKQEDSEGSDQHSSRRSIPPLISSHGFASIGHGSLMTESSGNSRRRPWKRCLRTVARLFDSIAATDFKSLYDLVTRNAPPSCAEFRIQFHAIGLSKT